MQYELQTTLGIILDSDHTIHDAIERLLCAMDRVLQDPDYANVSKFRVEAGNSNSEIVVGILFEEGVGAQYVDDLATEILHKAIHLFQDQESTLSEESVRLQSVYA